MESAHGLATAKRSPGGRPPFVKDDDVPKNPSAAQGVRARALAQDTDSAFSSNDGSRSPARPRKSAADCVLHSRESRLERRRLRREYVRVPKT